MVKRKRRPAKKRKRAKPLPNGHRAIMGSRKHPRRSRDFFPTPPWATRALMECVQSPKYSWNADKKSVWEPACGEGHMAEVLREYFGAVYSSDIYDYGYADGRFDFIGDDDPHHYNHPTDWIITNPPFGDKTEAFVLRALELACVGVAMFVRSQWLQSCGRYKSIFGPHPPTQVAYFSERVPLCKGRWNPDGSTATDYVWLVWIKGVAPRPSLWIPPGQKTALTRPDDRERFTKHPVVRRQTNERVAA